MEQVPGNGTHPRRPPAYLSALLRNGAPSGSGYQTSAQTIEPETIGPKAKGEKARSQHTAPGRQSQSPRSSESSDPSAGDAELWFDVTSKQPPNVGLPWSDDKIKSPCFMPENVQSNELKEDRKQYPPGAQQEKRTCTCLTTNNSITDYRELIDDLTVENQELKERIRKLERQKRTGMEEGKLLEVKYYNFPPEHRRAFEDTILNFTATKIDRSRDEVRKHKSNPNGKQLPTPGSAPKERSSESLNSRPGDSGYVSMPNSGPTSTATNNPGVVHKNAKPSTEVSKEQHIRSFLHDIPKGLLPTHPDMMTERQKKNMVVRRLEQLFTGKIKAKALIASHDQSLQQQEVSNMAARADRANGSNVPQEGVREAHILPIPTSMDLKHTGPAKLSSTPSQDTALSSPDDSDNPGDSKRTSSPQRPTRPLDLDPDRDQIPSDNMEYLHHLGVSTTKLSTKELSDTELEAEGWIYLNLLMNMAQLHMMNVTPEFVRSALFDVSTKFQISNDGQKIRWRGGTEGTRLSSDSDNSTPSGDHGEVENTGSGGDEKRTVKSRLGQLDIANAQNVMHSGSRLDLDTSFHYKPMFPQRSSSGDYALQAGGESQHTSSTTAASEVTNTSRGRRSKHRRSGTSSSRRRQEDGPVVFYSGAEFCIDLSSDRTNISTTPQMTGVCKDGYRSHTEDNALGTPLSRPEVFRTTSGSLMQSRPFKDYSIGDPHLRPAPHVLVGKTPITGDEDFDLGLEWSSEPPPPTPLIDFNASGLGGTQPADHCATSVQTRRPKLENLTHDSVLGFAQKNGMPIATMNVIRDPTNSHLADDITAKLELMSAFANRSQQISEPELPVKVEILSAQEIRLEPSQLPDPSSYYEAMSTSDSEDPSNGSSTSGLGYFRQPITTGYWHQVPWTRSGAHLPYEKAQPKSDFSGSGSDSSIDMLATLREVDATAVAEKEAQFEMECVDGGSSAASVDGRNLSFSDDDIGSGQEEEDEAMDDFDNESSDDD